MAKEKEHEKKHEKKKEHKEHEKKKEMKGSMHSCKAAMMGKKKQNQSLLAPSSSLAGADSSLARLARSYSHN